jgi:hypothetical protein
VARAHDRAELEVGARRVERRQAHEGLDDGDLALPHQQHRHELDLHQEGVQQVGAVQQRVVLEPDLAAARHERLEVLVVVVHRVLVAEQDLDDLGVEGAAGLHLADVGETAEPAGDVTRRERLALERGDDPDDVGVALRGDDHDAQLVG